VQVVQRQLYGGTYEFVKYYLKQTLNVEVTYVDSAHVHEFKAAIRPNTKVQLLLRWSSYNMTAQTLNR